MNHILKNLSLINMEGIRYILREFFFIILYSTILFISAGTIKWINAWIYVFLIFIFQISLITALIIFNPGLINERGRLIRAATKKYEILFIVIYVITTILISILAGLDVMRYKWTSLPALYIYPGILLFIFSSIIGIWSMSINPFFAATQRIQREKKHLVIKTGPYKYIRHPGYFSWIIGAVSYPLLLGSLISFIPIILLIIVFIARTYLEDNSLKNELEGYYNYTKITKYRLIPFIW